jgi:hypothetical protein
VARDREGAGQVLAPSNLPASISPRKLVATAKLRWRIARDYEELKQELGLGHFKNRNWRGFHHHASLCMAAYGFLVVERCLFPPPRRFRCGPNGITPRAIASLRRQIATHLAHALPRCPCCLRQFV